MLSSFCSLVIFVVTEGLLIYFLPVEENKLITLHRSVILFSIFDHSAFLFKFSYSLFYCKLNPFGVPKTFHSSIPPG